MGETINILTLNCWGLWLVSKRREARMRSVILLDRLKRLDWLAFVVAPQITSFKDPVRSAFA